MRVKLPIQKIRPEQVPTPRVGIGQERLIGREGFEAGRKNRTSIAMEPSFACGCGPLGAGGLRREEKNRRQPPAPPEMDAHAPNVRASGFAIAARRQRGATDCLLRTKQTSRLLFPAFMLTCEAKRCRSQAVVAERRRLTC